MEFENCVYQAWENFEKMVNGQKVFEKSQKFDQN